MEYSCTNNKITNVLSTDKAILAVFFISYIAGILLRYIEVHYFTTIAEWTSVLIGLVCMIKLNQ